MSSLLRKVFQQQKQETQKHNKNKQKQETQQEIDTTKANMGAKIENKRGCFVFSIVLLVLVLLCVTIMEVVSTSTSVGEKTKTVEMALKPSKKYSASLMPGVDPESDVKVVSSSIFAELIETATKHPRGRKMNDLTKDPVHNSMQVLVNTWTSGSFSPVHKHDEYSEAFVILQGALAFFTFTETGEVTCNVLSNTTPAVDKPTPSSVAAEDRALIVEKNGWHAMTAAPVELGYPGYAVIFEISGHTYDTSKATKILAPFAPVYGDGMNGDPAYFKTILSKCKRNPDSA